MSDDLAFLHPYFLGPSAENAEVFESILVELVRDHAFWRRNFHPEDGHLVPTEAQHREEYLAFVSRMRAELHRLSGELKRAVPFFHPRYIGHMSSDLLLPGLIAQLVTTIYNPNNVSEEAAPVTLEKELEVGRQLAVMLGFETDEEAEVCAWGHLTSGGTVANYEALWNLRSVKLYGVALRAAAEEIGFATEAVGPLDKPLADYAPWELLNLRLQDLIALRAQVGAAFRAGHDHRELVAFARAVRAQRIETLGAGGFFRRHPEVEPPCVLVAASAHYSWEKGMKVLGLGTDRLVRVAVDDHMRLDAGDLERRVAECLDGGVPVLGVVGVLGTTEFGTIDPIHEIVALRDRCRRAGHDFAIHVDGAWGGYLASMFREPDGSLRDREAMRKRFRHFPSASVHDAIAAVAHADSVTVDPHKMGYVPYPAGAFVARDRRVVDFITQKAAYVFDLGTSEEPVPLGRRLHNLGQYILEGSKPGAAAASVHVTHRVLPLHREGFGRLLEETVRACEHFYDTARERAEHLADRVRVVVPFEPDTNLVCLGLNPLGNESLAAMNAFGRRIFEAMRVDPTQPVQVKTFIASYTSLLAETLPAEQATRILGELGIDPATFRPVPDDPAREADHVFLLRHTLMNPWLLAERDGRSYVDAYWDYLETLIDETLGP